MSDEENKTYCMSGNLFRTSGGCLQLDDHNCESYALPYDKIIATKEEVEKAFEKHDAAIARQARMGEMKKLAEWLHSPECFGYIGTPKIWDRIVEEVEKRTQTLEGNTGQEKDMVCSICGAIDETHTAYCAKDGRVPHHLVLRQAPSAPKSSDGCGKECYGGLACGDIEAGYLVICPECKKKNERLNTRAIPVRPIMGHFFGHEANPAQAKKEELGHDATCPMTGKPHNFVCEVCGRYIRNQVEAANKTDSDKWYNAGWDDCKQNMEIENQQAAEKAMGELEEGLARHFVKMGWSLNIASARIIVKAAIKAARWPGAKGKVE